MVLDLAKEEGFQLSLWCFLFVHLAVTLRVVTSSLCLDAVTLGLAHHEKGLAVLDAIQEVCPPFSPEQTTTDFANLLTAYGVDCVTGDRHGRSTSLT